MLFDPRPIQRPNSQLLTDLQAARALFSVRYGWNMGNWLTIVYGHRSYCSLGAVQQVAFNEIHHTILTPARIERLWPEQKERFIHLIDAIYNALPGSLSNGLSLQDKQSRIMSFNDIPSTRDKKKHRRKVMRVFEKAIRNEEKRLEEVELA